MDGLTQSTKSTTMIPTYRLLEWLLISLEMYVHGTKQTPSLTFTMVIIRMPPTTLISSPTMIPLQKFTWATSAFLISEIMMELINLLLTSSIPTKMI